MNGPVHQMERRHQTGAAPGTLKPGVDALPTEVRYISYDSAGIREESSVSVSSLPRERGEAVLWVDVVGTGDVAVLEALGERFGFHPLALEDVVNVNQRPKLEAYGSDLFLIVRMYSMSTAPEPWQSEQLCVLLRPGLVVTLQERPGDCFTRVRERLRVKTRKLRTSGTDYLAYALLDAVIDGYQPVLDTFEERVEIIEDRMLDQPEDQDLKQLHTLRRDLIAFRRSIAPARDVVMGLMRDSDSMETITEETRLFLRDCYDHVIRTVEQIDTFRELCASLMDLYMSTVSNRTNDVMKVLTMIATVFIPLSFLVGLYGMNFDTASPWNMPELGARYGYPILVTIMTLVAGVLVAYFKREGLAVVHLEARFNRDLSP